MDKPMPSLFQFGEFTIDLDKIVWIKITKSDYYIRCVGMEKSIETSKANAEAVLKAWIAYKGKFDPKKER